MKTKASRSSLLGVTIIVAAVVVTAVLAEPTPMPPPKSAAKTEGSPSSGSGTGNRKPYKFGEGHTTEWANQHAQRTAASPSPSTGPVERKPYKFGEGHTTDWAASHATRKAGGSSSGSDHADKAVAEISANKAERHALLAAAHAKDTAAAQRILGRHGFEVEPGSVEIQNHDGWCVTFIDIRTHQAHTVCDHHWTP